MYERIIYTYLYIRKSVFVRLLRLVSGTAGSILTESKWHVIDVLSSNLTTFILD